MQEVVNLKFSLRRLHTNHQTAVVHGLTFARLTLHQRTEDVTTESLLLSEEAVRVLDTRS